MSLLRNQYELVLSARQALLEYCGTVSQSDFIRSSSNFGKGGSIRNMLVHVCNTYHGWLGPFVPAKALDEVEHDNMPSLVHCKNYFSLTDQLVFAFIEQYADKELTGLPIENEKEVLSFTPLQLFTQVVTHEFHHKGQILSLSRLWGYTPVDTDILR